MKAIARNGKSVTIFRTVFLGASDANNVFDRRGHKLRRFFQNGIKLVQTGTVHDRGG